MQYPRTIAWKRPSSSDRRLDTDAPQRQQVQNWFGKKDGNSVQMLQTANAACLLQRPLEPRGGAIRRRIKKVHQPTMCSSASERFQLENDGSVHVRGGCRQHEHGTTSAYRQHRKRQLAVPLQSVADCTRITVKFMISTPLSVKLS